MSESQGFIMKKQGESFSINGTMLGNVLCPCGLIVPIIEGLVWPEGANIVEIAQKEKHDSFRIGYCECGNMFLRNKIFNI